MDPFYEYEDCFTFLKTIENEDEFLTEPLKTDVYIILMKLCFLTAIQDSTGKSYLADDSLKAPMERVDLVYTKELNDYTKLCLDFSKIESMGAWSVPIDMDALIRSMTSDLELLTPDIQEIYTILSRCSARSVVEMIDSELTMKRLEFILLNMGDMLSRKVDFLTQVKEEVEAAQKRLRCFRDFLGFIGKSCSKVRELRDLLILAEDVGDNIACLLFLCLDKNKMEDPGMLRQMKAELTKQLHKLDPAKSDISKIYRRTLIKALTSEGNNPNSPDEFALDFLKSLQDNLLELCQSDTSTQSLTNSIRDLLLELHQELRLLKDFTMDSPWKKYSAKVDWRFEELWKRSDNIIKQAGCVTYCLYDYDKKESMAQEFISTVSDFLEEIKVAKKDARNIYNQIVHKSLRFKFPGTDKLGSIGSILHNLKAVVDSQPAVAPLKNQIEAFLDDLQLLRDAFTGTAKHEQAEDLLDRFKDVVYHTEYIIDLIVCKGSLRFSMKLGFFDAIEEVRMIRQELKKIENRETNEASVNLVSSEIASAKDDEAPSSNHIFGEETGDGSEFLIFGEEGGNIRETITSGSKRLEIVSIVGMAGVGKTTLANSIFQHFSGTNDFRVIARCTITQSYIMESLYRELLKHIIKEAKDLDKLEEGDLGKMLYQRLRSRKFLIFMDDIWNIRPLKSMSASLPDDENGSRIILTSRFDNIASSQSNWMSTIHRLSPLSNEKAWELLQAKVFGNENCPQELVEVGEEITRICSGLPLLVDVIGGVLRGAEKTRIDWQKVAKRLKAQPVHDLEERCRKVIEHSYHDLPDHLKSCFLYVAAFPKGHEISRWKLTSLWIAEGFVQQIPKDDPKSIDAEAKTYLDDLIARSLVTVSKTGRLGKPKASRVHDYVHDFASAKAKEDKFLLYVKSYVKDLTQYFCLSSEDYRMCFYPIKDKEKEKEKKKKDEDEDEDEDNEHSYVLVEGPRVRTVLGNQLPFSFNHLCFNFRLLRVLDLTGALTSDCGATLVLIHLRFLALRVFREKYLQDIHKFKRLETFLVYRAYIDENNGVLYLEHLSGMEKLMHFRLHDSFIFQYRGREAFQKLKLENLLSLSDPKLGYGRFSEKVMERMPNLRKLTCGFLDCWNSTRNCNFFPQLELLTKLESLKVIYNGSMAGGSYPCKFSFPPYLKRLCLGLFGRPWCEISILGKLENLEILNLGSKSFEGKTWNLGDEEFLKLKHLSFFDMDIEEWIVSEDQLPCLECVNVTECKQLEELPPCFGEKATLKRIFLSKCKTSLGLSAQNIKDCQEEYGNDKFMLTIRRPIQDK